MSRLFITGATGFLGGELAVALSKLDSIEKIFCLIRTRNDEDAVARLKQVFALHGDYFNRNKVVPVRGDLSRLPPTLIQASDTEILIDDSRRYVNKARAAGSPVTLQTWHGMVHVWQLFVTTLPEAQAAFDEIGTFFTQCSAGEAAGRGVVKTAQR